jgi:hypothetical protein
VANLSAVRAGALVIQLGICTIQRDRGRWVEEWVAFHYLVGFRKFYFFAHQCVDDTKEVLLRLQKVFDLQIFILSADLERPQLGAYQYAYQRFGAEVDWLAFIDGDEFLFSTLNHDLRLVLAPYAKENLSALGVYWLCFGSNGHRQEPSGLITENYTRRAADDFSPNRHVKSIVRGGLGDAVRAGPNSHLFHTPRGTFDELLRPVTQGLSEHVQPSHSRLRINHYVCQSYEYFKTFKQRSGAPDAGRLMVRPDSWWEDHDRNEVLDTAIRPLLPALKAILAEIRPAGARAYTLTYPSIEW